MKFLLLNQTFHPDVMATGLYLSEVAGQLAARGHEVEVLTSRRAYDEPSRKFPATETWRGVKITRIATTGFGKGAKWKRALDFASFMVACCWKLLTRRRPDVVVALTSPPLISFLGAVFARWRGARFVYWVMDLNPDEAIAAGWLRENSLAGRLLRWMSLYSFAHSTRIIALDCFMATRIEAKGISRERISVIPPWSLDAQVSFDAAGREAFRREHGLTDKFVVMYSGNHSPCHPLDTMMQAALELANDQRIQFVFIGGGSEFTRVQEFGRARNRRNITCLPYRPLAELSASLSAADLHAVVLGEPFVGIVHPCKVYNILRVGAPVLYIGPEPSHVTELTRQIQPTPGIVACTHGDAAKLVGILRERASNASRAGGRRVELGDFSESKLLPRLIGELEAVGKRE